MPDKPNKPAPVAAKTAVVAQPAPVAAKPVAVAPRPRHDPVPASAPASKSVLAAKSAPAAKPAVSPAVAKPPVAAAAKPAEEGKRKRGRPPGAKNVVKPAVAMVPVASPRPATIAAKPVTPKPIKTPTKPVAPRAAATSSEGQETMTDTITKIQDTAKKFTGEAGARTQAMFGDISGRAKGAYEKSVKLTEELTEFQKGNVEAIVESSKLAAKAAETLGQNAADYARKSYETGTAAFKTFASAKSPTELFKLQSDYLKSYFDSAVAESSKVTEAWLKLAGDVAQPLSNRVAVAVEKVKLGAAI